MGAGSGLRIEGLADRIGVDAETGTVSLTLDTSLYPLSALYAAAYVLLDRCFVVLDRAGEGRHRVTASWKKSAPDATPERLAGELANELLSCAWRAHIAHENRATIEDTTARALAGALGPPTLDDLETFSFDAATFDDPLGIAMSWEDKYGKKKSAAAAGAENPPGEAEEKEPSK